MTKEFSDLVGCRVPVQLAAMPGVGTTELIAAVADAGGVGMLGAPLLSAEVLAGVLDDLQARTRGVVGVNFLVPFLDRGTLVVAAQRARVVEFFYGDPDADLVRAAAAHGARVGWQIGSRAEAEAAEAAGCHYVVAQGTEAGGHVRGVSSVLPLLSQVLGAVRVPVLAAGGLATARDVAAVTAAGAAGVRVGTRFLAAAESGAHPRHVEAVLAAGPGDTVLTEAFSVLWPEAPHRVLRSCIAAAERLQSDVAGEIVTPAGLMSVPRFGVMSPTRETTGHVEAMALYAGESAAAVTRVEPAADIVADLARGFLPAEPASVGLVRRLFEAFRSRDVETVLALLADDVTWHFPGRLGRLAGDHRGRDAVLEFLAAVPGLTDDTFRIEPDDVVGGERTVVALFRGRGERAGRTLDNPTALRIRIEGGRIAELWEFVWDLEHVEAFWS
jgi:NAD(P)H-dependent flavin oxidoreductase YrpB (nitropropane dioxygenase family)/ketosteroid isomerase-like protein